MSELIIITADDAYRKTTSGEALLVCAYSDDGMFEKFNLEGAISFRDFQAAVPGLARDREIIFYCA